jgi:hypothetical protein
MIKLNFYKLLFETHDVGDETDCSFTPYRVFILETRLYPLIYKMFPNKNLEIFLKSEYNEERNRMDVYLVIRDLQIESNNGNGEIEANEAIETNRETKLDKEDNLVTLTKENKEIIQRKIDDINSNNINYALIDIYELYDSISLHDKKSKRAINLQEKIPFSWFRSVLEYTGLNSSYNPFIRPEGIYLTFNPDSEYKKAYYEVCQFLIDRVKDFYKRGIIILDKSDDNSHDNFIDNWNLISLDERIYEPNWTDSRFARNKVDFLLRKIQGDPYIRLAISDNLVKRHMLAKTFLNEKISFVFEGSYVKVAVNSLEEAYYVSALVVSTVNVVGRVLVIMFHRLSDIYLYYDYAKTKYLEDNSVIYYTNENTIVFSCLLPNSEKNSLDDLKIEFRNNALDRLIDVSKVSKLSNLSPHEIVIAEYS